MADTTVDITNNTPSPICLPPVPGRREWPNGITLIPGLNRVPRSYVEAYSTFYSLVVDAYGRPMMETVKAPVEVDAKDEKGRPVKSVAMQDVERQARRFPGREALDRLSKRPVRISNGTTKSVGPAITIHGDGEIAPGTPLGPKPPVDLPENAKHAMALIGVTTDREALGRWAAFDPRPELKHAAQAKLEALA
jgi:hypothetical protein